MAHCHVFDDAAFMELRPYFTTKCRPQEGIEMRRRDVIKGLAVLPAVTAAANRKKQQSNPFRHGIASGDPDDSSVVIWTRITAEGLDQSVLWEVSRDSHFSTLVASGQQLTTHHRDFTVKVLVTDLLPGTHYYFRFKWGDWSSETGRTATLPTGSLDKLGIAMASCSNFAFGYFNAYEAIAKDDAIDVVLHLGDYIYEYGAAGWGAETALRIDRVHRPFNEIVSLSDYRERHAQYKADHGSRLMHASKPLLLVWDDHESANNPWIGGAQNHHSPEEGLWRDRRNNSIQAYYEWMPVRDPQIGADRKQFWRAYQFGDLATLVTLESRHTGRSEQLSYDDHIDTIKSDEDAFRFQTDILGSPDRTMLSPDMEQFLGEALSTSAESGVAWRLIGNAIPMAKTPAPDIGSIGISMPKADSGVPGTSADLVWKGKYNLPLYLDTWDGYPWARQRFYDQCRALGVQDLIVMTGDSHSFWANKLRDNDDIAMGVEIGTSGITSPGDFIEQGFDINTALRIDQALIAQAPDVVWTSNMYQGYVRVTVSKENLKVDYVAVSTVTESAWDVKIVKSKQIIRTGNTVTFS